MGKEFQKAEKELVHRLLRNVHVHLGPDFTMLIGKVLISVGVSLVMDGTLMNICFLI